MDLILRPAGPSELPDWIDGLERAFGGAAVPDEVAVLQPMLYPERTLAAYDGDLLAGTAGSFQFDMTVPGGVAPAAGVTMVGVAPTHRRRGVLTAMMQRQLDDLRALGRDGFAALWASEWPIYGRFGYGMAGWLGTIKVPRAAGGLARAVPLSGRVRDVPPATVPDVAGAAFEEVRLRTPGQLARRPVDWAWVLADLPHWRHGASELRTVVYETPAGVRGYAAYRTKSEWVDGVPNGTVLVHEVLAADTEAHAALWQFLLGIDLMGQVEYPKIAPDDPLPLLLADPRRAPLQLRDGLFVRLLDVPRALAARRYATAGSVVLEVTDAFLPEVGGRFRLDGGPDGASCEPTSAAADLTLSSRDLSAAYLGGVRLDVLGRAGLVAETTPGALAAAAAMFTWSPLPHQTWVF